MQDSYIHKGLRKQLVKLLQNKGITDQRILDGFERIPRHFFIDQAFAEWAYKDVPFKIDADQTISQPYTVAFMTHLLDVKIGDKILEIGTGSGFQAALLAFMGAKTYTIERQEALYIKTGKLLHKLGFDQIRLLLGDGFEGSPRFAPFDKIIVTAGAESVPQKLLEQLAVGGRMIIPVGDYNDVLKMKRITKTSPNSFSEENFGNFKFVPFLPGVERMKPQ